MILAILQARMSSSRLPGKVLRDLLGQPMLLRQIERIKRSKCIDKLVLATSTDKSDDAIEKIAKENGIECFRGSLEDVLDRFYQAAKQYNPEHIVRLTGDCPLIDWEVIDEVIDLHIKDNNDYTNNTITPTFPDGLDVEIIKYNIFEYTWENAKKISERDNVTIYIYTKPEKFKLGCLKNNEDFSNLRWTVDEPEDFMLIEEIYKNLYCNKKDFVMQDVIRLLNEKPDLIKINSLYERNEGLKKSLANDGIFFRKDR